MQTFALELVAILNYPKILSITILEFSQMSKSSKQCRRDQTAPLNIKEQSPFFMR